MAENPFVLPSRPLRVSPPGMGVVSDVWWLFVGLLLAAGCVFMVGYPMPALIDDYGIRDSAKPLPSAHLEKGSCSSKLFLVTCDATLVSGNVSRTEHYFFTDLRFDPYSAMVVADPAHPEILTTDLALDKMTNRLVTMAIGGPFFILVGGFIVVGMLRRMGRHAAVRRALNGQELRTVNLRFGGRTHRGNWVVSHQRPDTSVETLKWTTGKRATPILVGGAQNLILGVTAGDGMIAMPLDSKLKWVKVTRAERKALLAAIAPPPR